MFQASQLLSNSEGLAHSLQHPASVLQLAPGLTNQWMACWLVNILSVNPEYDESINKSKICTTAHFVSIFTFLYLPLQVPSYSVFSMSFLLHYSCSISKLPFASPSYNWGWVFFFFFSLNFFIIIWNSLSLKNFHSASLPSTWSATQLWPLLVSGEARTARILYFQPLISGCRFFQERKREWLLGGYQSVCLLAHLPRSVSWLPTSLTCQQYYTSSRSCFDFVWINTQKWEWWIIC